MDHNRTGVNPRSPEALPRLPVLPASGQLERTTVNLIPRAAAALARAIELTGDSKTDTVNRALQLYAFVQNELAQGNSIFTGPAKGELSRIVLT